VISLTAQKTAKTKTVLHMDIASTALASVHKDGVTLIAKLQYVSHQQLAPATVSVDQKGKGHWKLYVNVKEDGMAQHVIQDTLFQTTAWFWTMALSNVSNCTPVLTAKMKNAH
jgi:hypothetical protein